MAQEQANKDEQIGFHKGALSTLAKEREEMQRILQVVEQLMNMHIKSLKELGVDLAEQAKESQQGQQGEGQTGQSGLDDMVNKPQ
ncbi:MAG: hypothetical protein ACOCZ6_01900 [Nanoarchaeota archaeon]